MKSKYLSKTARPDYKEQGVRFPERVFLYMGLSSISILFLGLTVSFLYTHFQHHLPGFRLPLIFHVNTIIIVVSSFTFYRSVHALKNDDTTQFRSLLGITFALGLTFLTLQYFGWKTLMLNGVSVNGFQSASYLYLISGVHALHVVGGVIGLAYCYIRSLIQMNNPVADLMFVTDPVKKMRIGLLATYWHFVDILWVYLYVFFLIMLF